MSQTINNVAKESCVSIKAVVKNIVEILYDLRLADFRISHVSTLIVCLPEKKDKIFISIVLMFVFYLMSYVITCLNIKFY